MVEKTFPREPASQLAFAQQLGKSFATYKAYENGDRDLKLEDAERLAARFGVRAESLLPPAALRRSAWPLQAFSGERLTPKWLKWWFSGDAASQVMPVVAEAVGDSAEDETRALLDSIVARFGAESRALLRSARVKKVLGSVESALHRVLEEIARQHDVKEEWRRRIRAIETPESVHQRCARLDMERADALAAEERAKQSLEEAEARMAKLREYVASLEEKLRECPSRDQS